MIATEVPGPIRFARYAYGPNRLGYCGPDAADELLGEATTGGDLRRIRELASGFEGAAHRVLAVAGSREHPKIRAELPEFTRLIPGARAAYVPDSGHLWTVEHPELFTRMNDET